MQYVLYTAERFTPMIVRASVYTRNLIRELKKIILRYQTRKRRSGEKHLGDLEIYSSDQQYSWKTKIAAGSILVIAFFILVAIVRALQ